MDPNNAWTDEYAFGNVSSTTNQWVWNEQGMNSTIYKLLTSTVAQYCNQTGGLVTPYYQTVEPTYFKPVFIAGKDQNFQQFGGIVPLVALYEIDWAAYNNATTQPLNFPPYRKRLKCFRKFQTNTKPENL